jgi:hypothetical protein
MADTSIIIDVKWSVPDVTTGITGYNVYRVEGEDKTFLAFVSVDGSNSYLYTGSRGVQYQFEVRSTDGTTESEPLKVFYPDGTTLYTPTTLTPTGNPMMIVLDSQYLSKDEFLNYPNGLKLSTNSALYTSVVLDTLPQAASEEVNRYTRRHLTPRRSTRSITASPSARTSYT